MINHIVLWNFKPELSEADKKEAGETLKKELCSLKDKIDGILAIDVVINELETSNREIALISSFESVEALNAYVVHPEHVKVGGFVKSVTCDRACLDY